MADMEELCASKGGFVDVVAAALGELRDRNGTAGGEAGARSEFELLALEVDESDPGEDPGGDVAMY